VADRRIEIEWGLGMDGWTSREDSRIALLQAGRYEAAALIEHLTEERPRFQQTNVLAPVGAVRSEGLDEYCGAIAFGNFYILPGTAIAKLFEQPINQDGGDLTTGLITRLVCFHALNELTIFDDPIRSQNAVDRFFKTVAERFSAKWDREHEELMAALRDTTSRLKVYDPLAWGQRDTEGWNPRGLAS
jgi:hypothetical protein